MSRGTTAGSPQPGTGRRRWLLLAGVLLPVALVIGTPVAMVAARGLPPGLAPGSQVRSPAPAPADQRPPVADADVIAAVAGRLDRCFDPASPPPWTCPQLLTGGPGAWQVRGDSLSGATVSYEGNDQFTVATHFVAVLAAPADPSSILAIDAGPVQALVHWDGETLDVDRIDRQQVGPAVPRPTTDDDASVLRLAAAHLAACARQTTVQVRQGCPSGLVAQSAVQACADAQPAVMWKQSGDPLTGAKVGYDTPTGLYHIIGHDSLDESLVQPSQCKGTGRRQGDYTLVMVLERSRMGTPVPAFLQFAWT